MLIDIRSRCWILTVFLCAKQKYQFPNEIKFSCRNDVILTTYSQHIFFLYVCVLIYSIHSMHFYVHFIQNCMLPHCPPKKRGTKPCFKSPIYRKKHQLNKGNKSNVDSMYKPMHKTIKSRESEMQLNCSAWKQNKKKKSFGMHITE